MIEVLILVLIALFSITIHEFSHGWTAYQLGDNTPQESGRLSLNPLKHIDPFGTVILPLILVAAIGIPAGYAKPIPINPYNFKNPRKDVMWVGLAGPASNFMVASVLAIILKFQMPDFLWQVITSALILNLALCVFNLMPIPPLDGSRVITYFLPYKNAHSYLKMEFLGFIVIMALIPLGFFDWFIRPLIRLLLSILSVKGVII